MAIGNIPARKRGFGYDPVTRSLGVYVDGALVQSFPPTPGRTYFVNNITGASTNDGLSWGTAMDEINTAVTASETYRQLGGEDPGRSDTYNDYVRNTIMVQGTETAYTAVTALPNYADIIGLGADPSGNGGGIARMDGKGVADACDTSATTVRGVNLYNLQFTQSVAGASYGLDIAGAMYRSRIEHCGFTNNTTAGIHIKKAGSLIIDDCHTIQDQFNSTYGMHIGLTTGGFNACKVTNSYFHGTTAAVLSETNNASDTWWDNCIFKGGTYGFQDTGAGATSEVYYFSVTHCYAYGTNGSTIGQGGFVVTTSPATRYFNNIDNTAGTHFVYTSRVS